VCGGVWNFESVENPYGLLHGQHALHDGEVTREGADVRIGTRLGWGELDLVGLTAAKKLGCCDDHCLGLIIRWQIAVVLGRCALGSESRYRSARLQEHDVVTHGDYWKCSDVLKGEGDAFAGFRLESLCIELHLIVARELDFCVRKCGWGSDKGSENQ
jgi:hypothetical protein